MSEEPYVLHLGDSRVVLKDIADNSVDSVVTDPPYSLVSIVKRFGNATEDDVYRNVESRTIFNQGASPYARAARGFMGQKWDTGETAFDPAFWVEVMRVLKPGGHLLAFSGTRTYHRMAVAIEDAGFEIRDQIGWAYGSGFPKSHNVSKEFDKRAGAEREVVGRYQPPGMEKPWNLQNAKDERGVEMFASSRNNLDITAPATDLAKQWSGWGTALKPAWEPICVARKPLIGSVADNVTAYGTGAINIDACRVETDENLNGGAYANEGGRGVSNSLRQGSGMKQPGKTTGKEFVQPLGRWPANLIHDGSDEVLSNFPEAPGAVGDVKGTEPSTVTNGIYGEFNGRMAQPARRDSGSAARFFYCAKASPADRDEGLEDFIYGEKRETPMAGRGEGGLKCAKCQKWKASGSPCRCPEPEFEQQPFNGRENKNIHPTVKPTELMRYLCRLVTPPGGVVLDPFMGSGSTGKAAMMEGFRFIGIEMGEEYMEIARLRVEFGRRAATLPRQPRKKPKPMPKTPSEPAGLMADLFSYK